MPLGGDLYRIGVGGEESEGGGFLTAVSVPTFAAIHVESGDDDDYDDEDEDEDDEGVDRRSFASNPKEERRRSKPKPKRLGLEGLIPGAFVLRDAVSVKECKDIIRSCESSLGGFPAFDAGKNRHGALQIVVSDGAADVVLRTVGRHVDVDALRSGIDDDDVGDDGEGNDGYEMVGVNRRWRVYRYQPGTGETFAPHIDAGFPPSGLSEDGTEHQYDILIIPV